MRALTFNPSKAIPGTVYWAIISDPNLVHPDQCPTATHLTPFKVTVQKVMILKNNMYMVPSGVVGKPDTIRYEIFAKEKRDKGREFKISMNHDQTPIFTTKEAAFSFLAMTILADEERLNEHEKRQKKYSGTYHLKNNT